MEPDLGFDANIKAGELDDAKGRLAEKGGCEEESGDGVQIRDKEQCAGKVAEDRVDGE